MTIVWIILWLVAGLVLLRIHTAFWTAIYRRRRFGDEVHFARTGDGWRLAIHRFRPQKRRFREAVLLCHGLSANRYNFDLDDDRSLARHLAEAGFDVWVLELRGSGLSDRPRWRSGRRWDFDFDSHLRFDAPAALDEVLQRSDCQQLFWVGHSMGGMLGYGLASGAGNLDAAGSLRGLVTVSSPARLDGSRVARLAAPFLRLACLGRAVPFRPLARFFAPFMGRGPMTATVLHPANVDRGDIHRAMVNLVESSSSALMRQFLSWVRSGRFDSRDGREDYAAGLVRIRVPLLLMAADRDRIAPPKSVTAVYEQIQIEDKQLRVFGVDSGDDVDFGHGDILLSRAASELVFVEIRHWLEQRATGAEEADDDG
ncbi:MAG: alpha/beta fold hydrolase [Deltaproteobacteria bacterium]|nr:alpha/beta fold hydrolase [Deltaproteobacteria bacterium]